MRIGKARSPYRSSLKDILDHVLPDVLTPLREAPPPLRLTQPRATVLTPGIAGGTERPACKCGRAVQFKEMRNGRPRYRTECQRCRLHRRWHHPTDQKPIALPHAARPRCYVPGCPNAVSVRVQRASPGDRPGWVTPDVTGVLQASPWCYRHKVLNDRPLGVLPPPPAYPRQNRDAVFGTGANQWIAWRARFRMGLGLPAFGVVSWVYDTQGNRVITVSVLGRGFRVTAWPDLVAAVAFWTCRLPPRRTEEFPPTRYTWPTYGTIATVWGVSPALLAWIVWELRVGRLAVQGSFVERQPCTGADGVPYTQTLKYLLNPETWQWTEATPIDQSNVARSPTHRLDSAPPPQPVALPWWPRVPPSVAQKRKAKRLSASRPKSTSG